MKKKFAISAVAVVLLILGGVLWARPWREDPRIGEIREIGEQLRQQAAQAEADGKEVDPQQRRALFEAMRKKLETLSESDRKRTEESLRQQGMDDMQAKLRTFLALTPSERSKELDRLIDQQELIRLVLPPSSGSGANSPAGGGSPPAGASGNSSKRPSMLSNEFLKNWIRTTTPQTRAETVEYIRSLQDRRQQRNLPPATLPEIIRSMFALHRK